MAKNYDLTNQRFSRLLVINLKEKGKSNGIYHAMLNRCLNPINTQYKRYGARGITICPEWRDDFQSKIEAGGEI